MFTVRLKSILAIVTVICIVSAASAQVGSESIGRSTMKMLRQHRSGNTDLKPRRTQSKGAPKRIFQLYKMAQEENEAVIEKESESETTQTAPITENAETTQPGIEKPIDIRKPTEKTTIDTEVISMPGDSRASGLLSLIPEQTLACLRVNQMDYSLGQLDLFLEGITPGPAGTSMIVRAQLAQLINDPLLEGINTNGQFALFALKASDQLTETGDPDIFAGLLMPISDSVFFQKHQQLQQLAADYAMIGIESPKSDEGRKNVVSIMQGSKLISVLDPRQAEASGQVPIWAYLNTNLLKDIAMGAIDKTGGMPQINEAQKDQVLKQARIFEEFISDTENLTIQLFPSADILVADIDLAIIPGSELAAKLNEDVLNPPATADAMTKQLSAYIKTKTVDPATSDDPAVKALKTTGDAQVVLSVNTLEFAGTMITIGIQQAQQSGQMDQQQAMGAMMIQMMITGMASQVKSNIAIAIKPEDDNLNVELAVPKEHVMELIKLGKSLNQPGQGPGMNGSNGNMPPGGMMNFEIK